MSQQNPVDADAFPEGTAHGRTGPAQSPPARAPDEDTRSPIGIIYPSRSGGSGHIVTINAANTVACTCEAAAYGRECWAMKQAKS